MLRSVCFPRRSFRHATAAWIVLSGAIACGRPSPGRLYGEVLADSSIDREGPESFTDGGTDVDAAANGLAVSASADSGPPIVVPWDAAMASLPSDAAPPLMGCSPSPERCDGIDNDCDGLLDEDSVCLPECTGFALLGESYKYCALGETVEAAQAQCALDAMALARIDGEQAGQLLVAALGALESPPGAPDLDPQRPVRVGGSDAAQEGAWHWMAASGQPDPQAPFWEGGPEGAVVSGAYAPWAAGQPNDNDDQEDCLALLVYAGADGDSGQWNDVNCQSLYFFLCQTIGGD